MKDTIALPTRQHLNEVVTRSIAEHILRSGDRAFYLTSGIIQKATKGDLFWSRPLHQSKLNFILDSIIRQRLGVTRIRSQRAGFVNLHSKVTESFCTSHLSSPAKKFLIEKGIIESDHEYIPGVKARGYRPTEATWKSGMVMAPIYPAHIAKYNQIHRDLKAKKNKRVQADGVDLDYLTEHLLRLELPRESIVSELVSDYGRVMESGDWRQAEGFHAKSFQIGAVICHNWTFSRCAAGRLHYPLTNLAKGIRSRLRYQGEPLVDADVSCCQPLIASTIYPAGDECNAEREEYLQSVQSGLFYEDLARRANYEGTRGALKKDVLKWVFFGGQTYSCKNGIQLEQPLWKAFREMFPQLARVLSFSKAEIIAKCNPFRGDRDLAIQLQKKEADIFIDGVLRKIAANYRDVPAFPIHDCLMTTAEHFDLVSGLIRSEFADQLGIIPKVKASFCKEEGKGGEQEEKGAFPYVLSFGEG